MSKQILLRIELPTDARVFISQFREYVARDLDGQSDVPELFHYDSTGKPAQGMPRTRFVGGRRWVGILTDEDRADMLYKVMGNAVRAVHHLCGSVTPVKFEEHTLGLSQIYTPRSYWIREMVIKKRRQRTRETEQKELIRQRILSGLHRQADEYGIAWPGDDALDLKVNDDFRQRGLELRTTQGATGEYVDLIDASFTVKTELLGFWFAGNLTSRGYGRIGVDLAALAVNFRREQAAPRRMAA
ncbi:type IV CRISPR-associated endonuclease Csf5 [Paraburkholderia sp. SIMBA_054]|uniref:type IV CRISPR-associated endonuclease Csf5 n=1 Tax=Paraburkholderia sp. SIMBA_054 TaxID=3085795 RepID=UPI00397C7575